MLLTVTSADVIASAVLATGGLVGVAVGYVAWQLRNHPAAEPLAKMSAFPGVGGLCYAVAVFVRDPAVAAVLLGVVYATLSIAPAYFLVFTITYTGNGQWLTQRRRRVLLAVYAFSATVSGVETALFTEVTIRTVDGLTMPVVTGATTRIPFTLLFSYPAIVVGFVLLGRFLISARNMYRKQTAVIILAVLSTVVGNMVFEAGFSPHPGLNLTSVFFAVETVVILLALFRYEFLNVEPLAPDTVIEEIDDPVLVFDDTHTLVDANPSAVSLFGFETPAGVDVSEAVPDLFTAIEHDREFVTDGGTKRDSTSVYDLNEAPITDQYDRERGCVVVMRDVTLQKQREATLEELQSVSQEFLAAETQRDVLQTAVEATEDVLGYPYSGALLYDEEADALRLAALSDPLFDAFTGVDVPGETSTLTRLDGSETAEVPLVTHGGDVWDVFESGEPMLGEPLEPGGDRASPVSLGGSLLFPLGDHGVLGISAGPDHDGFSEDDRRFGRTLASATENALDRVTTDQQLRESRSLLERRKDQIEFFNSVLRHDLLNGMTVVEGHAEHLEEYVEPGGEHHLDTIQQWTGDITALARKVRSMTKAVTGDADVEMEPVDLGPILQQKARKLERSYDDVTVSLASDEVPAVLADELAPEIIENVLSNAVEHSDAGPTVISITTSHDSDRVQLRVSDNGPGVPDDMKEDILEKEVTSSDSGSIGFGLYFVRVMMDLYGGEVRFEDADPSDFDGDVVGTPGAAVVLSFRRADTETVDPIGTTAE